MFTASGNKGLVDRLQLGKYDEAYSDKLLEADNVYLNRSSMLTRRPPIVPKGFQFGKGKVLDSKSTKNHYVVLREIAIEDIPNRSALYEHITNFGTTTGTRSITNPNPTLPITTGQTGLGAAYNYDFTPRSNMVAVEFYDKERGTLIEGFSYLFAIHHPTSSKDTSGNHAVNRLARLTSGVGFSDGGFEPVILGVYKSYRESNASVEALKYIPPTHLQIQNDIYSGNDTYQDSAKSVAYTCYKEDPAYRILSRHYLELGVEDFKLSDHEFVGYNYEDNNIKNINVYDDSVVFTFCGLGYVISKEGVLRCIHSNALLPTLKDIDQQSIKTYPLAQKLNKRLDIPVRIFLHKEVENDTSQLTPNTESLSEEQFKAKYPEYSGILDNLSLVTSFVPVKTGDDTYSKDEYYVMPDVKFLIPATDIPADCKYIAKGQTDKRSAWFGIPCVRKGYLSKRGWFTVTDDIKFQTGNGISAGGVGCSAGLFEEIADSEHDVQKEIEHIFTGVPPDQQDTTASDDGSEPATNTNGENEEQEEDTNRAGPLQAIRFKSGSTGSDNYYVTVKKAGKTPDLKVYAHFELDYNSDEFRDFLRAKPLLVLPNAHGERGYNFELFKSVGYVHSVTSPASVCQFEESSGLGFIMPENTSNNHLDPMIMYQRKNLLNNKIDDLNFVGSEVTDKKFYKQTTDDDGNVTTTEVTDAGNNSDDAKQIPLRFSAIGSYFPLAGNRLTFTNIRNMFYSENILNVSSSEDVQANIFFDFVKYYFQFIANRASSITVFLDMGLVDPIRQVNTEKDPNTFTTVDREGRQDNIINVELLEDRLVVHTEGGLSAIAPGFNIINRFAEIAITSNLIKDSTALIGANNERLYVAAFESELGGYTSDDLNKELKEIPYISKIINMLDAHRLALLLPEKGNVIYILSQFVDRKFKGFARFILPITIVNVLREDQDKIVLESETGEAYEMDFATNLDTNFTDIVINNGARENKEIISTIQKTHLLDVDSQQSTFFGEQIIERLGIGMAGKPKMRLEFITNGVDGSVTKGKDVNLGEREHREIIEEGADVKKNSQPFFCYTPEQKRTGGSTVERITIKCRTLQWKLDTPVKNMMLDQPRSFVFVQFLDDNIKLYHRDSGGPIEGLPVWGDYTSSAGKHKPNIVDMKTHTDYYAPDEDFEPYFLDNTGLITKLIYNATTDRMEEENLVQTNIMNAKSFCFISDTLIAVLIGSIVKIIDITKQRQQEIDEIDLSELIDDTPLYIDVSGGFSNDGKPSFLMVMTAIGIFRIKIGGVALLTGEQLTFGKDFQKGFTAPVGIASLDNFAFSMDAGNGSLHRFTLKQEKSVVKGGTITVPGGATSETRDGYECGLLQLPQTVTLSSGVQSESNDQVTVPVDNKANPGGAGNLTGAATRFKNPTKGGTGTGVSNTENAIIVGLSQGKVSLYTDDGTTQKIIPYTFVPGPNPRFVLGTSIVPAISDILAVMPRKGHDDHFLMNIAGEAISQATNTKIDALSPDGLSGRIDKAFIQYDSGDATTGHISVVDAGNLKVFRFDEGGSGTPSIVADFAMTSSSDNIVGIYIIEGFILVINSGTTGSTVNILTTEGQSATITEDGTSTFALEGGIATTTFYDGELWYQDSDGDYKRVDLDIEEVEGGQVQTDRFRLSLSSGSQRPFLTGHINNAPTRYPSSWFALSGSFARDGFPMFYSQLYKFNPSMARWAIQDQVAYNSFFQNNLASDMYRYLQVISNSTPYNDGGVPAGPFYSTMFVDESSSSADYKKQNSSTPVILGPGHFPACMACDEDHLFIPFYEGDIVPYNIKDKNYGFNRRRGQVDPVKGAKLAYSTPLRNPVERNWYVVNYLFNLLAYRAGVGLHNVSSTSVSPDGDIKRDYHLQGVMGGVSAMEVYKNNNTFVAIYGVSNAYGFANIWERFYTSVDSSTPSGYRGLDQRKLAKNTGRKTGQPMAGIRGEGAFLSVVDVTDKQPYLIIQTADNRALEQDAGVADNVKYSIYDKDHNLVAGGGVTSGVANSKKFGRGTYLPKFDIPDEIKEQSAKDFYNYMPATATQYQSLVTDDKYRADIRYDYRMITNANFPKGGKITCVFRDGNTDSDNIYVIIQPPALQSDLPKGMLFKCNIKSLVTDKPGLNPKTLDYEDVTYLAGPRGRQRRYSFKRHKLKVIPTNAPFTQVTNVETEDIAEQFVGGLRGGVTDPISISLPHWHYFYSVDWDNANSVFIGTTAYYIYVFDKDFNVKTRRRINEEVGLTTWGAGHQFPPPEDKTHAISVSTANKKIYFLKRKRVRLNRQYFYERGYAITGIGFIPIKDPLFSMRGVLNYDPRRQLKLQIYPYGRGSISRSWDGRRIYNPDPKAERFVRDNERVMSIPYVEELSYTLERDTESQRNQQIMVGDPQETCLKAPQIGTCVRNDIFNLLSVGHSHGIIYAAAENSLNVPYRKAVAYKINDTLDVTKTVIERQTDKEVEVPTDESPQKLSALNAEVFIAVDDDPNGVGSIDLQDCEITSEPIDRSDCGDVPPDCRAFEALTGEAGDSISVADYCKCGQKELPTPQSGYFWVFEAVYGGSPRMFVTNSLTARRGANADNFVKLTTRATKAPSLFLFKNHAVPFK